MLGSTFRSLRRSQKLRRFSKILGDLNVPKSIEEMQRKGDLQSRVFDEYIDYLMQCAEVQGVLKAHGVARDRLIKIYSLLENSGAGVWVRGHYVPASALFFGQTLHYALVMTARTSEDSAILCSQRLIAYFERSETGMIPEAGPIMTLK